MNGGLSQFVRVLQSIPQVTVEPITNIEPAVYLSVSSAQWDALMDEKYGPKGEDE